MQAKPLGHQVLVEDAEGVVVFSDGLDRSKPLQVGHLNPAQQKADPLLQPIRLLLQSAIAGQLLKQLEAHRQRTGQENREEHGEHLAAGAVQLHYFGPLMMNVHRSQHDVSRGVHP